jgi:hypothetical protein
MWQGLRCEVRVNGEAWSSASSNHPSRAHGLEEVLAFASLGETIYRLGGGW